MVFLTKPLPPLSLVIEFDLLNAGLFGLGWGSGLGVSLTVVVLEEYPLILNLLKRLEKRFFVDDDDFSQIDNEDLMYFTPTV